MLYVALFICLAGITGASEHILRGVPLLRKSFYDPGKDFTCLDGSETIPFSLVNDDYCDCADGSDEPGTSACTNGRFFCLNKGHKSLELLSSRVNDGVCDCCDGSDEYDSAARCTNTCDELGKKAREERKLKLERQKAGYEKKVEYISDGGKKKTEKHDKLAKLKSEIGMLDAELKVLEEAKNSAEEPEKIAKEEQDKKWEEERQAKMAAEKEAQAKKAFEILDSNKDNLVSIEEIQQRNKVDNAGNVSKEEAIDYLGGEEPLNFDTFYAMAWDKVHDNINLDEDKPKDKDGDAKDDAVKDDEVKDDKVKDEDEFKDIKDDIKDEDDDFDDDDDDDVDVDDKKDEKVYDEATQALIDVADKARDELQKAKDKKQELDVQIQEAEKFLEMDFGKNNEFIPLYEQCYEYTDREYTYKLCLFQKCSQRNKNGGSETSLGVWGHWDGPGGDRYSVMKYENGEKCWNGPSRSTIVKLKCGAEEKVTAAMEPNRCEYLFEFFTSAICQPVDHSAYHEEL